MGCSALVVFTVLSKLLSRTRRRRKARVGESEEQSLGLDEDEGEYNSGEDPIYYATSRDLGTITSTSMSTIGSQFTEVGETQTYSLGSILEVSSSHLGPGLSRQRSTTDVTIDSTTFAETQAVGVIPILEINMHSKKKKTKTSPASKDHLTIAPSSSSMHFSSTRASEICVWFPDDEFPFEG
ncbi:hypothetical protein AAF712_013962 [Marasmius tenuissimus]|uniref:Uncharacterized protein n=1 Tax=Marasmius tenuissimus TaxID=585030 RepID=A0ABR2ZCF8_9AGAR